MTDEKDVININEADVDVLSALPGIGPTLAERIVEFRQTVHPFEEVIELAAVTGISERMVRNLEGRITVASPDVGRVEAPEEGASEGADESETPVVFLAPEESMESEPVPEVVRDEVRLGDLAEAEALAGTEGEVEDSVEGVESTLADTVTVTSPAPDGAKREEVEEVEPVAPTAPEEAPSPAVDRSQQAQRRGCFVLFAGTVLGALVGTALTLAILAAINGGTLLYAEADNRLRNDLENNNQAQNQLMDQFSSVESRLGDTVTRVSDAEQRQQEMDGALDDAQQMIDRMEQDVASLEEMDDLLDKRITAVAVAAETFNAFLDGLRDLLFEVQGPPPTSSPTSPATEPAETGQPTPSPTGGAEMPTIQPTPETGGPTATTTGSGQPTRTPQPTYTPLTIPTGTPEPQP